MTEEFNLSNCIFETSVLDPFENYVDINAINKIHVKEFIRLLKEEINNLTLDGEETGDFLMFLDKLAGEKLI